MQSVLDMKAKLVILGDLYPKTIKEFPVLPENDFCIANLECAFTDSNQEIKKDGPSLKVPKERVSVLKKMGVNLVGLANNHVCDFSVTGFKDTLSILEQNGIKHFGEFSKGSTIEIINGKRIGFYFVCEHQYNHFEKEQFGVNLFEPERCYEEIEQLKAKSDFVIVLFHGGKEYYEYPTPLQQATCHKFVDSGADVVLCQHSHCVGSEEKYQNSVILYGQGNFIFPYSENEHFKSGLIVQIEIDDNNSFRISYLPTIHEKPDVIEIAAKDKAEKIMRSFFERSNKLSDETSEKLYDAYVEKCGFDFLYRLFNKSKFYIRLDTSRFFKNRMMKKYIRKNQNYLLYLYNYFNCETHVEYIKAILDKQINQGDDK